jgi:hypothetical protein
MFLMYTSRSSQRELVETSDEVVIETDTIFSDFIFSDCLFGTFSCNYSPDEDNCYLLRQHNK